MKIQESGGHLIWVCLAVMLPFTTLQASAKINAYIGNKNNDDTEGFVISIFPDIIANRTIISSRDFVCSEENGCSLQPDILNMTLDGHNVTYREAVVQINVIKKPFLERAKVIYLDSDPFNFGSTLALRDNSPFLEYFYEQNKKEGYVVNFSLDSNNAIKFVNAPPANSIMNFDNVFTAKTFYSNSSSSITTGSYRFCFTNKLDRNSAEVYFGVPNDSLDSWKTMLTKSIASNSTSNYKNIRFSLYTNTSRLIGNFDLPYSTLFANGVPSIAGFDQTFDYGRKCDFYTGSLFLKKFNLMYYYVEYSADYAIQATLDGFDSSTSPEPDSKSSSESSNFWLKLIIFLIVIAGIGFLIYKYIYTEGRQTDEYQMQQNLKQNIELRPMDEESSKT